MSRRRRRATWRAVGGLVLAILVVAAVSRWLAALLVLALIGAAWLYLRGWRTERRHMTALYARPTVLYRHYMYDPHWRDGRRPVYYGISNRYDLRCEQHAAGSWWWPLVVPVWSTCQTWPDRAQAEAAERQAIAADCPIGNQEHNPRYWAQEPERRALRAQAARQTYQITG